MYNKNYIVFALERECVCVVRFSPLFIHGHLAYIIYTCFS